MKTLHYDKSVELEFNDDKHHYTVAWLHEIYKKFYDIKNGDTLDGVTSVLQIIAKPALIYWSANKAAEFIDKYLPVGKTLDELEKKKLVDGCKTAHRTLKTDAGDLGSMLHELIEKFIKKEPYQEPVNAILKKSFEQFKAWAVEHKVEFKSSERRILSLKYKYAGTLDITAKVDGVNCIIDLKTSSGIWDEYFLQCAAYKAALEEEFPDANVEKVIIVRCGKDGEFEVKETSDHEKNFEAFLAALTLHRRMKEMKFKTKNGGGK